LSYYKEIEAGNVQIKRNIMSGTLYFGRCPSLKKTQRSMQLNMYYRQLPFSKLHSTSPVAH
jgi:hypothetical protein